MSPTVSRVQRWVTGSSLSWERRHGETTDATVFKFIAFQSSLIYIWQLLQNFDFVRYHMCHHNIAHVFSMYHSHTCSRRRSDLKPRGCFFFFSQWSLLIELVEALSVSSSHFTWTTTISALSHLRLISMFGSYIWTHSWLRDRRQIVRLQT